MNETHTRSKRTNNRLFYGLLAAIGVSLALFSVFGPNGARARSEAARTPLPADAWQLSTAPNRTVSEPPEKNELASVFAVEVHVNVGGADVALSLNVAGPDASARTLRRHANREGVARFDIGPQARYVHSITAEASAPGYTTANAKVRDGRAQIRLSKALSARGIVVNAWGDPVERAAVLVAKTGVAVVTDRGGEFSVRIPEPGSYRVQITHNRYRNTVQTVALPAPGLTLTLDAGATVTGRVSLSTGAPIPGCGVSAPGANSVTDSDGRYELSGLAPGQTLVMCELIETVRRAEAGAANVDFVVRDALLQVRIEDGLGRGLYGASVVIQADGAGDEGGVVTKFRFLKTPRLLYAVPPGSLPEVVVAAPGYEQSRWRAERPVAAGTMAEVVIALHSLGPQEQWLLHVASADGTIPSHVEVYGLDARGRVLTSQSARPSADGTVRVVPPAADIAELRVRDSRNPALEVICWRHSQGAPAHRLTARLPVGSRLVVKTSPSARWRVESATGKRMPVAFRIAVPADGVAVPAGRRVLVSMSRLPAGHYRLRNEDGSAPRDSVPFSVDEPPDDIVLDAE